MRYVGASVTFQYDSESGVLKTPLPACVRIAWPNPLFYMLQVPLSRKLCSRRVRIRIGCIKREAEIEEENLKMYTNSEGEIVQQGSWKSVR